jgi:tRNA(fMet)-specific endonuclease VapC
MNNYVLDTNTCIYWLKGIEEIREKVKQVGANNLKITIVTLAELRYGAYNSRKVEENLKITFNKFFSRGFQALYPP